MNVPAASRRPRITPGRLLLLSTGLFCLGAAALVTDGLRDDPQPSALALVLGNQVDRDGKPSPRLRARLDRAGELYRDGLVERVLVSGGVGREGFDEADAMRDYLVGRGVPVGRILLDHGGVDTFASARSTTALLLPRGKVGDGRGTVIVVSQYFHLSRAKLALRRFGLGGVTAAHARFWEWRDLYSIPREMVGYLQYSVRRYPAPDPAPLPADTGG